MIKYTIYLEYGLMPASNIYTYIFEKPFDCTTTATTTTRDLYYFSHNAAYYHRTELIHHPLFLGHPPLAVFRTLQNKAVTFTQHFLFLYPLLRNHKISKTSLCLLRFLLLPPLPMPSKNNLFWFPPFGVKNYMHTFFLNFTAAFLPTPIKNLSQKGTPPYTKNEIILGILFSYDLPITTAITPLLLWCL